MLVEPRVMWLFKGICTVHSPPRVNRIVNQHPDYKLEW